MADFYKHYGIEVIRQFTDGSFKKHVSDMGASYTELPIIDHDIIKYERDGQVKYSIIETVGESELVYITTQVPDDLDWGKLIRDVEAQHDGEASTQCPTKLKMVLDKAAEMAYKRIPQPENVFATGQVDEDQLIKEIRLTIIYLGYDIDWLKSDKRDKSDVDEEFLQKIIND